MYGRQNVWKKTDKAILTGYRNIYTVIVHGSEQLQNTIKAAWRIHIPGSFCFDC